MINSSPYVCTLASLLLVALPASQAATEATDQLPIELARYFTGGGNLYSDLPDNFPAFTLPAGMQLLGSIDRGNSQNLVISTSLDARAAQESLVSTFRAASGWALMPSMPSLPQGGFVAAGAAAAAALPPVNLCHVQLGSLSIDTAQASGVYISYGLPDPVRPKDCDPQAYQSPAFNIASSGVGAQMPMLEVPAEGVTTFTPRGNRGGSQERVAGAQVSTSMPVAELERYFAAQLQAQGWQQDAQYSGAFSTGSSWTRMAGERQLVAFLTLVGGGANTFDLTFRLLAN